MDWWRTSGGILRLLEFAEKHPGEIRADFRSQFGISFEEAGDTYSWVEAIYLFAALLKDPSSRSQAAHNDWKYPVSYEWMIISQLVDLTIAVNSKKGKAKPIEKPWKTEAKNKIGGSTLSREEVIRRLESMNNKE